MEGLRKKIVADWYDIREVLDDVHLLEDAFDFSMQEMKAITEGLRLSVEGGITEYKGKLLAGTYAFLESLEYDSRGFDTLVKRGRELSTIAYISLLQRLIAKGSIKIKDPNIEALEEMAKDSEEDVKAIMAEVQKRIKEDPAMRHHPSVKNILMQMSIYRRELEKMQNLVKNIPQEKKAAFLANFKNTFAEITDRIRENYREIEKEEEREAAKDIPSTHPLKKVDLKSLVKLFGQQGEEFHAIHSTLLFAGEERYKTRDILNTVSERKERTLLLVSTEQRRYAELETSEQNGKTNTSKGIGIAKAFSAEIIKILNRQSDRMI